ncbi:MAG: HlyD family efflux transporter periplasmic adaptor subunit [Aureliella sp.]
MTSRQLTLALGLCVLPLLHGCGKSTTKADASHEKPAKVEKLPVETDLANITLTADADRRLGITTAEVTRREVTQRRTLGGQAVVPSGKTIIVSAPLAGVIARVDSDAIATPGTAVKSGDPLLAIQPLLSAERDVPTPAEQVSLVGARANLIAAQTVAAGDVDRSLAEVEGAKITFNRAQKLFADRAGAKRAVDDAEAVLNIAQSTLAAAEERNTQLMKLLKMLDAKPLGGQASVLLMTTPIGGIVNRIEVSEGQAIASGAVLFEIVNLDTVWIRVPVFVDLLAEIQTHEPARLVSLSGSETKHAVDAKPIAAPPTADAITSSADLYYEIDNRELGLRPGQRVGVELATSTTEDSLIVPTGSIIYDIYGNTWVYSVTGERQYRRSRVSLRFVDGQDAVLAAGPKIGSSVVVDGAAELFGTEFGAGK